MIGNAFDRVPLLIWSTWKPPVLLPRPLPFSCYKQYIRVRIWFAVFPAYQMTDLKLRGMLEGTLHRVRDHCWSGECMVSTININIGTKEPMRGNGNCNTNQILIFGGWLYVMILLSIVQHGNVKLGCWELSLSVSLHSPCLCMVTLYSRGPRNKSTLLSDGMVNVRGSLCARVIIVCVDTRYSKPYWY